jgi:hypothetical protein
LVLNDEAEKLLAVFLFDPVVLLDDSLQHAECPTIWQKVSDGLQDVGCLALQPLSDAGLLDPLAGLVHAASCTGLPWGEVNAGNFMQLTIFPDQSQGQFFNAAGKPCKY